MGKKIKWGIILVSMLSISILYWNGKSVEDKEIKSEVNKSSQISKKMKLTPSSISNREEDKSLKKIIGTVLDNETYGIVDGARITIEEEDTYSNKNGYYEIQNPKREVLIPDGTYTFSVYYNNELQSKYIGYSIDSSWGITTFTFDMDRCRKIIDYGY